MLRGGWSLGTVYEWRKVGEYKYNPNIVPERELPEENYIPWADRWNVDMKLSKQLPLTDGRMASVYLDITNALNTKQLNSAGVADFGSYVEYVFNLRGKGEDVALGDESTLHVLTEPFKFDENDPSELWKKPISPHTEWIQYLGPRFYRLGVRLDL